MALTDLARVVISTEGPALTQVGFGTLLCAAAFTGIFGTNERVRTYTGSRLPCRTASLRPRPCTACSRALSRRTPARLP